MRFKTDSGITWSSLELVGLVEDEESRVYFEKFTKHFGLHPFHLTNLNAALNEILSTNLNSYDPDLKGFLLAYRNPKLLTSLGEIFYDTCFIHVDIETDFYVFRPEVGCKLKGVVNKKGLDHIGILVHKAFNVLIPKPDDEEDWPGDNVEIGQEVRFTITLLDFNSKLPFIRGVLNSNDYLHGCKLMLKSINNKRLSSKNNICGNSSNNVSKKNIKHAGKHTFFTTDSEDTDGDIPKVEEEIKPKVSEKKKKAKKRDKEFNKINESKTELVNVESEYDHYANNISLNGELMNNEESELSDPKNNSPRNYLKFENDTSEIKVEYNRDDNESILEDKSTIKKKSMKRRSDGTSKRDSKKIKVEQFDDTYEYTYDDAQESPTKQYKKHKGSLKLETSESEQTTPKKHSKKSNISDSLVVFENVKIKKERLTSGSEISQDENYVTISKTLKKDPDASSSTCDTQDESNTTKKKRKKHLKNAIIDTSTIKTEFDEHEFKDIAIKKENFNNNEGITKDIHSDQCVKNVNSSPRKKHNISSNDSTYDDEVNTNTTKRSKKKAVNEDIIDDGEIKLEKCSTTDNSDINNSDFRSTEKRKKRKKKLSTELNKTRDTDHEPEFDFNNVEIKIERFSDRDT
ncbi:hypothetical protein QLX08_007687 [Tetragonisca angustula]|uniref:DNA-directed RNA polymerase I subunit RPA43 n=1 Tax=Tetragonisca angustula TaxID=166442 RepID=A0AAW0ZN72_9HYME